MLGDIYTPTVVVTAGPTLTVQARFSVLYTDLSRPQADLSSNLEVHAYGPDTNEDAITETVSAVGTNYDEYEFTFALSELTSGKGLYTLYPLHTQQSLTFWPPSLELDYRYTFGLVNDVSATATSFVTTLSESLDDSWKDSLIVFISGALADLGPRKIEGYNGTTKAITCAALPAAPADGVGFKTINH